MGRKIRMGRIRVGKRMSGEDDWEEDKFGRRMCGIRVARRGVGRVKNGRTLRNTHTQCSEIHRSRRCFVVDH